jgi:hypothetical protein
MPQALAGAHLVALLRELAPPIASTPVAFVDLDRIADSIRLIRTSCARASVAYAVKASYLRPLLNAAREAGAGISVFSELELGLAREAGFAPHEIVYNGVGRHGAELGAAMSSRSANCGRCLRPGRAGRLQRPLACASMVRADQLRTAPKSTVCWGCPSPMSADAWTLPKTPGLPSMP